MGSWNATCYISKLPIHSGEEIVLILLRKYDSAYGYLPYTSYAYEKYVPFCLPIFGKYNDYGNIEDIEDASDVLEHLRSVKIVDKNGNSINTDSLTNESLADFTDNVLRGNYFLKDDIRSNPPLFGMMIKRKLYDRLLNHYKNRKCYDEDMTYEEYLKNEITSKVNEMSEEYDEIEDKRTIEFLKESEFNDFYLIRIAPVDGYYDIASYLKRKILKENDEKSLTYLIDIIFLKLCLQALRMGYYCVSGAGSQSCEMLIHKEVAQFVIEECDNTIKEYREENDDDATDEEILTEYLF